MPASSSSPNQPPRRVDRRHRGGRAGGAVGPLVAVITLVALVALTAPTASASDGVRPSGGSQATTLTTIEGSDSSARLPGTTLEAEERDDGGTNAAPWIIGSGVAAALAVGLGGTILKRRAG